MYTHIYFIVQTLRMMPYAPNLSSPISPPISNLPSILLPHLVHGRNTDRGHRDSRLEPLITHTHCWSQAY